MKKSKRQVVQKNIFSDSNQKQPSEQNNVQLHPIYFFQQNNHSPQQDQHNIWNNLRQESTLKQHEIHQINLHQQLNRNIAKIQPQREVEVEQHHLNVQKNTTNNENPLFEILRINQTKEYSKNKIVLSPTEDEQKKKKIELLKQKYLKKRVESKNSMPISKQQIPENVNKIITKIQNIPNHQDNEVKNQKLKTQQKINNVIKLKDPQQKIIQIESQIKSQQNQLLLGNIAFINQQPTNTMIEEKKLYKIPYSPISKIIKHKAIEQQVVEPLNLYNNQQQYIQKVSSEKPMINYEENGLYINTNDKKQNKQEQKIRPPPVKSTNKLQNQIKRIPPPVKNKNLQELLAKKIKKQDHIQISTKQIEDFKDPFAYQQSNYQIASKQILTETVTNQIDDEYCEKIIEKQTINLQKTKDSQHLSDQQIKNILNCWLNNPVQACEIIFPLNSIKLHTYFRGGQISQLKLTSNNVNFSPILSKMISEFILKNQLQLSQTQKQLAYELALQYFYGNLNELTIHFLLILIKLGKPYLQKYKTVFNEKQIIYYSKIIEYKYIFWQSQINNFVQFVVQNCDLSQESYCWLLLLSTNDKLLNEISNKPFQNMKYPLMILITSKIFLKNNKNVLSIYLKMINILIQQFKKHKLIENVLNQLKELQINEKNYQYSKQLKLKLISLMTQTKVSEQKRESKNQKQQSKGQKDGIFGYWNKAVDKIKNATQFVDRSEKDKEKPKEEEKKDEVIYDQILKRYLINGKIPDDQNGSSQATSNDQNGVQPMKVAPPPPKINKCSIPPPSVSVKKNRIAGSNRYA